jgi:uncharacterized membrane protein YedE/YeeE
MTVKLIGLVSGLGFGFVIAWARLTEPAVIRRMLLLQEGDVFLLMGSAIVVAAAGVRLLRALKVRAFVTGEPIAWKTAPVEQRHVAGSALFGAGWSVACTCPGPIAAMIGQGQIAGVVVAAGLLAGIALRHRVGHRASLPAAASIAPPAGTVRPQ